MKRQCAVRGVRVSGETSIFARTSNNRAYGDFAKRPVAALLAKCGHFFGARRSALGLLKRTTEAAGQNNLTARVVPPTLSLFRHILAPSVWHVQLQGRYFDNGTFSPGTAPIKQI